LGNISWFVNVLDGSNPDAVAKYYESIKYGLIFKRLPIPGKHPVFWLIMVSFHCSYCRLRSYGTNDYVQCCINGLSRSLWVEDFADRSQNIARIVGKEEVKHIFKCIQCTSEYTSDFMDGLVEIPTLKIQLFGCATLFQDSSQTKEHYTK
ncbi:hypothetical protein H5410_036153, partial [Solanum commersonii]